MDLNKQFLLTKIEPHRLSVLLLLVRKQSGLEYTVLTDKHRTSQAEDPVVVVVVVVAVGIQNKVDLNKQFLLTKIEPHRLSVLLLLVRKQSGLE